MKESDQTKKRVIKSCKVSSKEILAYIKEITQQMDSTSEHTAQLATAQILFLNEFIVNKAFRFTLIKDYIEAMELYYKSVHLNTEQMTEH